MTRATPEKVDLFIAPGMVYPIDLSKVDEHYGIRSDGSAHLICSMAKEIRELRAWKERASPILSEMSTTHEGDPDYRLATEWRGKCEHLKLCATIEELLK